MIADMNTSSNRPLSPHLQVYRLPMTALMSITHRITGAALTAGLLLISALFVAGALGESEFSFVMDLAMSPAGLIVLLAWSLALFYHLVNGVRHLIWDLGFGYEKHQAVASGWTVILATLALTGATWHYAGVFKQEFYGPYAEWVSAKTAAIKANFDQGVNADATEE